MRLHAGNFSWQERPLTRPVIKHHNLAHYLAHYLAEAPAAWDQALVVSIDHRVCGFAAYAFSDWNRRLVLLHLYVDAAARGQGIGRTLLDAIIRAYERMGFRIVGLDQTLYADRPGADTALS